MIGEILLVALLVSAACAIPGVFLVLRKMSLMSDAISHAVLPGIVVGFLFTHSYSSPLLFIGAVGTGLLTVILTESLVKTALVKEDAAIGLVFPALFSIGVILVSKYAGNAHLDIDAVLLGELIFTPLDRLTFRGYDMGPRTAWVMGIILLLNLAILLLFFKELKLSTFDAGLSTSLGFSPVLLQYILMIDVSITTVGAFDAVGSILVVALMIAPATTAYLLTDDLKRMLILSILLGMLASVLGFLLAWATDASAAGAMATVCGIFFLLAFLFAPERGLISQMRRKQSQKLEFAVTMLSIHLSHHKGEEQGELECHEQHLTEHINWDKHFASLVVKKALSEKVITRNQGLLELTETGEHLVKSAMMR